MRVDKKKKTASNASAINSARGHKMRRPEEVDSMQVTQEQRRVTEWCQHPPMFETRKIKKAATGR
jgi:hypothetical protein